MGRKMMYVRRSASGPVFESYEFERIFREYRGQP
jgi:hypothetical protein